MKRPFAGLSPSRGPDHSYDAIVIGSGIGGLTCANLLAQQGLRVLLIEQHYMVGGYCSTFRRNGYSFDAASHFYPLLGNPKTITGKLVSDLRVRTRWVKMDPVDQFHLPDGTSFCVPAEFDVYLSKLGAMFPEARDQLSRFFELVKKYYLLGVLWYFRDGSARNDEYAKKTVGEVIHGLFRDPKLKLVLTADCAHWGSPPSRTSFVFDSMLRYSYFLGNYYPAGGSQAFADELARRFEEMGGHILLRSRVTRILTAKKLALGTEVESGLNGKRRLARVHAGAIVSNADLLQTTENLLDAEAIDEDYRASVRRLRPTYPCFLMHLGVKGVPTDQLRMLHGYHWQSYNFDAVGKDAFLFKVFIPTLYEPALAPPNGHILIVQKVSEIAYASIVDWTAHKTALEQLVLAHLERLMPGLTTKCCVRLSASARTSYRYTLNHHGAMLGWEMAPDQVGELRPGIISPVTNLFFVGHWTRPGGGITPVMISALQAAQRITGQAWTRDAGLCIGPIHAKSPGIVADSTFRL